MTTPSLRTAPGLFAGAMLAALFADQVCAAEPAIQWRTDYNAARRSC